ncbi:uncharacterized protein LOC130778208 [Actinidia eriantha]|uniref:uncharacterized protein LOC130778208 n=1 Tax=Actinidia eriantha TaxID=165200 RepID=UPI002588829D|nr:uncharacterized protein LOC130778208 [Actinidia eriantha]
MAFLPTCDYSFAKYKMWTKKETNKLFDLCERFDIQFVVVADRFQLSRTIKELKDSDVSWTILIAWASSPGDVCGHPIVKEPYNISQEIERKRTLSMVLSQTRQQECKDAKVLAKQREYPCHACLHGMLKTLSCQTHRMLVQKVLRGLLLLLILHHLPPVCSLLLEILHLQHQWQRMPLLQLLFAWWMDLLFPQLSCVPVNVCDDEIYLLKNGENCLIFIGNSMDPDVMWQLFGISLDDEILNHLYFSSMTLHFWRSQMTVNEKRLQKMFLPLLKNCERKIYQINVLRQSFSTRYNSKLRRVVVMVMKHAVRALNIVKPSKWINIHATRTNSEIQIIINVFIYDDIAETGMRLRNTLLVSPDLMITKR